MKTKIRKTVAMFLSIFMIVVAISGCGEEAEVSSASSAESTASVIEYSMTKEKMAKIFSELEYSAGIYTLEVVEILNDCAKFGWDFVPYEENKNDILTEEQVSKYEESQISQYLKDSYFLRVNGKILYNPEIPNYYTENKTILNILIVADENGNKIGHMFTKVCEEFETCAILKASAY